MKSYAEENYVNKDYDLQSVGVYYKIPIDDIKKCYRNEFDVDEDGYTYIEELSMDEMATTRVNAVWCETDAREYYEYLCDCISVNYNHYLVYAKACTWDKADGYAFANNIEKAFSRSYDVTQYVIASSSDGKALKICEHSHDVPMGYSVYIIGLTDDEYDVLEYADFDEIEKFKNVVEPTLIDVA